MRFMTESRGGLDYLRSATELLQSISATDQFAGLYEPADLQWWWREDQAEDPRRQIFWRDEQGTFVAMLLLYDAGDQWCCDFIRVPDLESAADTALLEACLDRTRDLKGAASIRVRSDDERFVAALSADGWIREEDEATVQTYLPADRREAVDLPKGFFFRTREEANDALHHMAVTGRSPADIERRLREGSLYRPDLDYAVYHSSEALAGYAIFWMDPVTKVGLVEPMRTEVEFQRQGIASALLSEGVGRVKAEGATIVKVSYEVSNSAARGLYHKVGFRDLFAKELFRKTR